ncbi:MAG: hypothetical protein KKI07_02740 [Euryarchaeota archaeon]|nr:hypothetical protein [Euryarchaeota archaeon]
MKNMRKKEQQNSATEERKRILEYISSKEDDIEGLSILVPAFRQIYQIIDKFAKKWFVIPKYTWIQIGVLIVLFAVWRNFVPVTILMILLVVNIVCELVSRNVDKIARFFSRKERVQTFLDKLDLYEDDEIKDFLDRNELETDDIQNLVKKLDERNRLSSGMIAYIVDSQNIESKLLNFLFLEEDGKNLLDNFTDESLITIIDGNRGNLTLKTTKAIIEKYADNMLVLMSVCSFQNVSTSLERNLGINLRKRLEIVKKHLPQRGWLLDVSLIKKLSLLASFIVTALLIGLIMHLNPYNVVTEFFNWASATMRMGDMMILVFLCVIIIFFFVFGITFNLLEWIFNTIWSKELDKSIAEMEKEWSGN